MPYLPAILRFGVLFVLATFMGLPALADTIHALPYDLIYVRAAYKGANGSGNNTVWPDTVRPLIPDAGAKLMVLHSNGTREVLFPLEQYRNQIDTPSTAQLSAGSVSDPNVSFDAQWVVFTWYHDLTNLNGQRENLSRAGADLYKLNLQTRQLVRLTHQEFTPNSGNNANFDAHDSASSYPRVGVFNTGATFAPGGQIVFTSTRNNLLPPKVLNSGQRTSQLFRMGDDGRNVELIGHLNLAMALHPQILMDGRIAFSSWEEHGIRDVRQFALWAIGPDGRTWTSLSGFAEFAIVHHFMTQMPNGDVVVTRYYNFNNNGFGDLIRYGLNPGPADGTADPAPGSGKIPFEPVDQVKLTPFTTDDDYPAPCPGHEDNAYGSASLSTCASSDRRGKFTHPAATVSAYGAPNTADLLAVYAPGPANHNGIYVGNGVDTPWYHGEIVLIPDGQAIPIPPASTPGRPPQLQTILAEDAYNLQWPRPVVTYQALYGKAQPDAWPELNDAQITADRLTPGEPFGLIGSSSLTWRDTAQARSPFDYITDRDPFNYTSEQVYSWVHQGADAGIYSDDDIYAVRVLKQQGQTDRSYPNGASQFYVVGGERMRILGEVPVRKAGNPAVALPDGTSAADTSFLAKIPADTSVTFQALDRRGMVLNMAQTWHQVRPGEARYDCGGCHAHSKAPLNFSATAAAQPSYNILDLAHTTPLLAVSPSGATELATQAVGEVTVEYFRDIAPILEARCASCHGASSPAAGLPLTANAPTINRDGRNWPGAYYRLIRDTAVEFGPAPPAGTQNFYLEPQLTHYVRAFQSRQSLLIWKIWGERLDGRGNADRSDDVDYPSSLSHPDGFGVAGMTNDEKLKLTRWVDLGAPIEFATRWGFLEDDLRPTLVLRPSLTAARSAGTFSGLQISAFDTDSGVDPSSLTVTCDRALGNMAAGSNLAAGLGLDAQGGILSIPLPRAVALAEGATFTVSVRDRAGHTTTILRSYVANAGYTIDGNASAMWYDPAQSGHGMVFEAIDVAGVPSLLASWYVYLNGQQRWLLGVGPINGSSVHIPLTINSGGDFPPAFNAASVQSAPWGSLDITFASAQSAHAQWTSSYPGFNNGSIDLVPIAQVLKPADDPSSAAVRSCHSGNWYNPAQSGHGFEIEVIPAGSERRLLVVWYVYDQGQPMYLVGTGTIVGDHADVQFTRTHGGQFPPVFNPTQVTNESWGNASFQFTDANHATVSWTPTAAGFSSGSLVLTRLTQLLERACN